MVDYLVKNGISINGEAYEGIYIVYNRPTFNYITAAYAEIGLPEEFEQNYQKHHQKGTKSYKKVRKAPPKMY